MLRRWDSIFPFHSLFITFYLFQKRLQSWKWPWNRFQGTKASCWKLEGPVWTRRSLYSQFNGCQKHGTSSRYSQLSASLYGRVLPLWILGNQFNNRLWDHNRATPISARLRSGIHWGLLKLSVVHPRLIYRRNWYRIIQMRFAIWRPIYRIDLQIGQLKWRKSIFGTLMHLQISSCFIKFVFNHFYPALECWPLLSRGAQVATSLNIVSPYPCCKHSL